MIRDQRDRLIEEALSLARVRLADQLGEVNVEIRRVAETTHPIEDIGAQLDRLEVLRVAVEEPVDVGERVLVHLVTDVDAGLEDQLLLRRHRHVVAVVSDLLVEREVEVIAALVDVDVEIEIIVELVSDVDEHLRLAAAEGRDLALDLSQCLAQLVGALRVPGQRLLEDPRSLSLGGGVPLAEVLGQLRGDADRLVLLAEGDEGVGEELEAEGVARRDPEEAVELHQRPARLLGVHQVELREAAEDVRVVVLVVEQALTYADVVVVAILREQPLGGQAEVLDRGLFAALAGVELRDAEALGDRADVELGDHPEAFEPLRDLAGLEERLGDKLVGRDRVGCPTDRVQALGDLEVDVEPRRVEAEDLPVDGDRLGGLVVLGVEVGDLAEAIDRPRGVTSADQAVREHHPRADVARVRLDDRLVLAGRPVVLTTPRVLGGRRQCSLSIERHPYSTFCLLVRSVRQVRMSGPLVWSYVYESASRRIASGSREASRK